MSITLPLQIVGEIWHNRSELQQALCQLPPGQTVILDANSEGASLGAFGVLDLLQEIPHKYTITKWSNSVEPVPYPKIRCSKISHFFYLSWRYWIDEIENTSAENIFGLFVGRYSTARNYILYDVAHTWRDKFLLSKMTSQVTDIWGDMYPTQIVSLDTFDQWADLDKQAIIKSWWSTHPVPSIDSRDVRDQYSEPEIAAANCALSLLSHYRKFNIELICESYTRGLTFFPTEKTIRPIIGNKPFIVYGPKNYLLHLKGLGFKTFEHVWDESYDQYEGPERWKKMRDVIDTICLWDKEKLQQVLGQCAEVTRHNRTRLRELINDFKKF